jgi:diguanylate cyclase (GGDEF)-like protein
MEALRQQVRELESELAEAHARMDALTRIVGSIDDHLYINEILPDGRRRSLFRGPGRERLMGGEPADGDWGRAWVEAIHPDDLHLHVAHTERYLRGEFSEVTYRLIGLDGVTRWIRGGGRARRVGERIISEGICRDVTVEVEAAERIRAALVESERASRTDALTGVFNRRHFAEEARRELERARRRGTVPGVVLLDVDHFKRINDGYGHAAGDAVLVAVAQRIAERVRPSDTVARWGGEEFAVLAPELEDDAALRRLAERIRTGVGALEVRLGGAAVRVTASLGAARATARYATPDEVLDAADRALYTAKRQGRDQTRVVDDRRGGRALRVLAG